VTDSAKLLHFTILGGSADPPAPLNDATGDKCFLSGRGQGHVSNFYTVDLEHFATASRRHTGDIHNSTVVGLFYDTLPPTKLPTSYHRFGQDLSYK